MTETVVHVTTLKQWKSVLDVWFAQGYNWSYSTGYTEERFDLGSRQLGLNIQGYDEISYFSKNNYDGKVLEYEEFMAQQKEGNETKTYYVTQGQLDFINTIYEELYSLDELLNRHGEAKNLFDDFSIPEGNDVLRYLGGDTSIEFKVKEPLYRLWRIDDDGDRVYMNFNSLRTPCYTMTKERAFTGLLEEIKKWKTPAWDMEEV